MSLCGFCSVSCKSFSMRHLVIAPFSKTKKPNGHNLHVLPFSVLIFIEIYWSSCTDSNRRCIAFNRKWEKPSTILRKGPLFSFLFNLVYLLALPIEWNVAVGKTSRTSMTVHWENLAPLINETVLYYIANAHHGNLSRAAIVSGDLRSANVQGLSAYTEHQVNVIGINSYGQPYNSSNVTALTEERGKCFFFWGGGDDMNRHAGVYVKYRGKKLLKKTKNIQANVNSLVRYQNHQKSVLNNYTM